VALNAIAIVAFIVFTPEIISEENAVVVQALRTAASVTVVVAYGISIWDERYARITTSMHVFVIGIFLAFLGDAIGGGISIIWRLVGRPPDWSLHSFWILGAFLTALAALHHITAPGIVEGHIPKKNAWLIGLAAGGATLIAGLVIVMNIHAPDWWWWRPSGLPPGAAPP
jgi:hypothetical protein